MMARVTVLVTAQVRAALQALHVAPLQVMTREALMQTMDTLTPTWDAMQAGLLWTPTEATAQATRLAMPHTPTSLTWSQ